MTCQRASAVNGRFLNSFVHLTAPGFPSIGTIGVFTALINSEGIICSDWDTVDTGAPSSGTPATEGLQELFREVNANQVLSGN